MGGASKKVSITGNATTLLQNAAQAAGISPFSSSAHPLPSHGIGMSVVVSMDMPVITPGLP
jgi:hypothetical protein